MWMFCCAFLLRLMQRFYLELSTWSAFFTSTLYCSEWNIEVNSLAGSHELWKKAGRHNRRKKTNFCFCDYNVFSSFFFFLRNGSVTEGTFYWSCGKANTVCWFKGKRSKQSTRKTPILFFCFVFTQWSWRFKLVHFGHSWEDVYLCTYAKCFLSFAEASLSVQFVTAFLGFLVMRREKKSNKKARQKTHVSSRCSIKTNCLGVVVRHWLRLNVSFTSGEL